MTNPTGLALIELMITLLVTCLLLASFLSAVQACQRWSSELVSLLERDANIWIAPLLLARWIAPAGNNRWGQEWTGFSLHPEGITIHSDIDGPDGFPDAGLSSSFEELVLRSSGTDLQVKSGSGSFQPLIKNVADFRARELAGGLVAITLDAVADRPLPAGREHVADSIELYFFLRNYRQNLFAEAPQ